MPPEDEEEFDGVTRWDSYDETDSYWLGEGDDPDDYMDEADE